MDDPLDTSELSPEPVVNSANATRRDTSEEAGARPSKGTASSDAESSDGTLGGDDEGGLFGSDSDAENEKPRKNFRKLDDEDLDSGDDEGRDDRVDDMFDDVDGDQQLEPEDSAVMELQLGRHAVPDPSDGELYLLRFPSFLGLEPAMFHEKGFQPPQTEHHSTAAPPADFSRYSVATSSLRWRRSPHDPAQIESNAKILRWSDGSLTMQLANNPQEQFEIPAKPLAPPQIDPLKPTPTSKRKGRNANAPTGYDSQLDSHTFLVTPQEGAQLLRITHHLTSSLTVLPSSDANDEALNRLQDSLAAAVRGNKQSADGGISMIKITEDPELAKKKAEIAERDRNRALKKRQALESRETERANRVLGKSGISRGGAAGLSVGALEDDDMPSPIRRRKSGVPGNKRRGGARNRDSDTDDDMPRGRTREDEYDKNDDFLADSDEEEDFEDGKGDDDDEEEEEEEEEEEAGDAEEKAAPKPQQPGSPKREREPEVDAPGEEEDDAAAVAAGPRGKRRRVIEEDDDE
ncbi:MAG: hypothetical protein M4579_006471 [Chaenotheca gracillima]|nr:MAG: hypothetical protein M4579_006471 [Chaenotheca gracillima]